MRVRACGLRCPVNLGHAPKTQHQQQSGERDAGAAGHSQVQGADMTPSNKHVRAKLLPTANAAAAANLARKEAAHAASFAAASRQSTYKVLLTILALVATALITEQVFHRRKKAHLPDPIRPRRWQVHGLPLPFAREVPGRLKLGPAQRRPVFHIFIVIASSKAPMSTPARSSKAPCNPCPASSPLPRWFCAQRLGAPQRQVPRRLPLRTQHALLLPSPLHYLVIQAYLCQHMADRPEILCMVR
ncbi:hypothetical protein V8E36_005032 [Tilletia maclaganii]